MRTVLVVMTDGLCWEYCWNQTKFSLFINFWGLTRCREINQFAVWHKHKTLYCLEERDSFLGRELLLTCFIELIPCGGKVWVLFHFSNRVFSMFLGSTSDAWHLVRQDVIIRANACQLSCTYKTFQIINKFKKVHLLFKVSEANAVT